MHLSDAERGIYLSLLLRYYDTEQPLPADRDLIYRLACARNADAVRAVDVVLEEFFDLEDDGWHNKRADEEITAFRDKSEKASRSARARWGDKSHADAMRSQSEGNANHEPLTINQSTTNNISSDKGSVGYTDDFEQAWSLYPKRPGASKKDSFKAWTARLNQGVTADQLIEGVKRYARYCVITRVESKYIKQPTTFFGPGEHYLADWAVTTEGQSHATSNTGSRPRGFEHGDAVGQQWLDEPE